MIADLTAFGTISLGGLIELLDNREHQQRVSFDFGSLTPGAIASYRGFYDHLAVGFGDPDEWRETAVKYETVTQLREALRACIGNTFDGYKGGTYLMGRDTPVWAANWGKTGSTAIVGICEYDYWTIIKTEWVSI